MKEQDKVDPFPHNQLYRRINAMMHAYIMHAYIMHAYIMHAYIMHAITHAYNAGKNACIAAALQRM